MRIAAGIILIIVGVWGLRGLIILLSELLTRISFIPLSVVPTMLWYIVPAAFYITGGIFCLRRKYWRVCLASASFAVLFAGFFAVGSLLSRYIFAGWIVWVTLVAAVTSVIFISRKREEWEEVSGRVDCRVSHGD